MPAVWTTWTISTRGTGPKPVVAVMETNDDNDDGYPDPEKAHLRLCFQSLEKALEKTGKSRRGFFGHRVIVTVDDRSV